MRRAGFQGALCLALCLNAAPLAAADRHAALEKVYEAADAIDAARAERDASREDEALRLLADAEGYLASARALDASVPRIGYELARIHVLRQDSRAAADALMPALRLEVPLEQHLRMVSLLDEIRAGQGQASLGVAWQRSKGMRNAGIATIVGGLALSALGLAVAYTSFDAAAAPVLHGGGVTDERLATNQAGWAITGLGGGVAGAGLGLTVAGQVRVGLLQAVLPGPWRLPRTRDSELYAGISVSGRLPTGPQRLAARRRALTPGEGRR